MLLTGVAAAAASAAPLSSRAAEHDALAVLSRVARDLARLGALLDPSS